MASVPAKPELDTISAGVVLRGSAATPPGARHHRGMTGWPCSRRSCRGCSRCLLAAVPGLSGTKHTACAGSSRVVFMPCARRWRSERPAPSCSFRQHKLGFQLAIGTAKQPGVGICFDVLKGSGKCVEDLNALGFLEMGGRT